MIRKIRKYISCVLAVVMIAGSAYSNGMVVRAADISEGEQTENADSNSEIEELESEDTERDNISEAEDVEQSNLEEEHEDSMEQEEDIIANSWRYINGESVERQQAYARSSSNAWQKVDGHYISSDGTSD